MRDAYLYEDCDVLKNTFFKIFLSGQDSNEN